MRDDSNVQSRETTTVSLPKPEMRWPVVVAGVATSGLYLALPERLTLGPSWLVAGLILSTLSAAIVTHRLRRHDLNRIFGFFSMGTMTVGMVWSLGALIAGLPG